MRKTDTIFKRCKTLAAGGTESDFQKGDELSREALNELLDALAKFIVANTITKGSSIKIDKYFRGETAFVLTLDEAEGRGKLEIQDEIIGRALLEEFPI